jgi:hypothetical protein
VRAERKALAAGGDLVLPVVSHTLQVVTPEGGPAAIYTVCLVRDDEGTYMVVCRELPEVLVFEQCERRALAAAQAAINRTLAA